MPFDKPDPKAIDAWLEGTLPPDEAAAVDAYFEANPDALPDAADQEDFGEMAGYVPETDASLDALIERMKTNPGLESQWASPTSDAGWQDLLEPGPMLGMLGPYEIESLIATGGMGILFKARDPKLARTVALKVLSPQLATNATARERFLREARAAAKLEHENILPIYAVHDGTVPYFAMRYADGGTLEDQLHTGQKLELEKLKTITKSVASALEAAHAAGIIHRDIKPANILFDEAEDKVWVCDFGIARSIDDPSLTYAGNIAGTPQYMSPEQAEGTGNLDGRSDLFSLGTVLYRAATGRNAFAGKTTAAVMRNVTESAPPSASEINAALPRWFAQLIENLLAKDPTDRPPDATTVIRAIETENAPATRSPSSHFPWLRTLGIAAVLTLVAVAFWPKEETTTVPARILIEGVQQPFADLSEAILAAPEGATLVLRGDITCPETIYTPRGKTLHLHATEAATILAGKDPAICFQGPTTLRGLTFSRPPNVATEAPIIAIRSSASALLENCEFQHLATGTKRDMPGLRLTGVAEASLSHCAFRMPGAYGLTLQTEAGHNAPTTTEITDSLFLCREAVHRRSNQLGDHEGNQLSITRSVLVCERVFGDSSYTTFHPLALSVSQSLVDSRGTLLWIPDEELESLLDRLTWQGKGNVYGNRLGSMIKTPQVQPQRRHTPRYVRSFEDLLRLAPTSTEAGGTETLIFQDLEINTPYTAAEIRAALRKGIDSPAVATLDSLAE